MGRRSGPARPGGGEPADACIMARRWTTRKRSAAAGREDSKGIRSPGRSTSASWCTSTAAEVHRSTVWRQRLDATTNWAVLTTAAMLSFFLSDTAARAHHPAAVEPDHPLLPADRGPPLPLLRGLPRPRAHAGGELPDPGRDATAGVADGRRGARWWRRDLDLPKYKTTLLEAIGFRLRRNYIFIFLIVLGGWCVKLVLHPDLATSWGEVWARIAVAGLPSWVMVLGAGSAFYAAAVRR